MKNFTTTLLLCLVILNTGIAANNHVRNTDNKQDRPTGSNSASSMRTANATETVDSILDWEWNSSTVAWDAHADSRVIDIVRNGNNNVLSAIGQIWTGTAYLNSDSASYTYDINNNETSQLIKGWSGSQFINGSRNVFTYNGANERIVQLYQIWNGAAFVNNTEYTYAYDTLGNFTTEIDSAWNGSAFKATQRYQYNYNSSKERTSGNRQRWNGSAYESEDQYYYTYNSGGQDSIFIDQVWDTIAHAYYNSAKTLYSYDLNNNLTKVIGESYNEYRTAYIKSTETNLSYDVNNFLLSEETQSFDSLGTKVIAGDSLYYYLEGLAGINELIKNNQNISVYPNPAEGLINVEFNGLSSGATTIHIYDALGRQVLTETTLANTNNKATQQINISGLESGIYFLQIKSDDGILTKQFIKE